jgi:hypothetical protein
VEAGACDNWHVCQLSELDVRLRLHSIDAAIYQGAFSTTGSPRAVISRDDRGSRMGQRHRDSQSQSSGALSHQLELAARSVEKPSSGSGRGSGSPRPERFLSEDAERAAGCEMGLGVEGAVDSGVNRQEAQTRSSCATLPVKRKRLSLP